MMTPPTFRTFRRELSSVWQTVAYPRKACNVLEQLSGATERRMIVPMTVRPQQRGRSQTWRTFLRNHVGAISCHAVGASSARPGDDDVVDTGLFSRGLTPPSGTAARLQAHGDCRRRPLGSTHVSWLAGCLGPTFTTGQGQARSGRDPPRSCAASTGQNAYARRLLHPAVCFVRGARTVSGDSFARHARSRSGNSGTLRARPAP